MATRLRAADLSGRFYGWDGLARDRRLDGPTGGPGSIHFTLGVVLLQIPADPEVDDPEFDWNARSEEHTSELQSR